MTTQTKQLHNWLNDRSQRELVLLTLTSLVIVYWLWLLLLADPLWQKQDAVKAEITTVQATVNDLQKQLQIFAEEADGPLAQQRHAELIKQLQDIDKILAPYKKQLISPQQLLFTLHTLLKDTQGLELVQLENLPATEVKTSHISKQKLYTHTFIIKLRGNYFATLTFLQKMEALPWLLHWEELDYKVTQYPNAEITLKLHILSNEEKLING